MLRQRYRGPAVSLYEWTCGGHVPGQPREEWADGYEIVVPRRGAFEWEIAGGRTLADPGTVTFLHPVEAYRVRHPIGGGDAGSVFALPAAGVRALLAEHDPAGAERAAPRFPRRNLALDGRTYLLHRLAVHAAGTPAADPLEVEERATAFVRAAVAQAHGAVRAGRRVPPTPRAAECAARALEVIAARYREPITLAEIARAAGASPYHLSRVVAAVTAVPIHRMVLRRRLRDAVELLLETRETIARIAVTVGFASHSHLTEAFRREFGVLPRALRAPRRRTDCLRARP